MRRNRPILLALLIGAMAACAGQPSRQGTSPPQAQVAQSPEEALRAQATRFWELRVKGDLAAQYEFLEPKAREGMTLTGFIRARGTIVFLSYRIEEVETVADQGRVVAKTSFRLNDPRTSGFGPWTQPAITRWVREGGVWYLKGSQDDAGQPLKAGERQP